MSNPDARRTDSRRSEVAANLAAVRARIERACQAADRRPDELTLIAITKFFPASDAALLAEAGVHELGESRDQEAAAKVAEFAELTDVAVRWHFIGRLQTNKARSVARYADLVHSVDRPGLVKALATGAEAAERQLPVLVQLNLDPEATEASGRPGERGGSAADQLLRLADQVSDEPALQLAGVMAIAPLEADPDPAFERLAAATERLVQAHPQARIVSAGMSGDLEAAIRHGATHLRVGTALLGRR